MGAILLASFIIYPGNKRQSKDPKLPPASMIDATPEKQPATSHNILISDSNNSSQLNQIDEIPNIKLSQKPEPKREHEPVIITDYENLAVIADDIQPDEDKSYATGNVGVADRYGMFVVGNEATITHTNQTGSIDSVYLPGDSSVELGGDLFSATDTEITYNLDGSRTIHSEKIIMGSSSNFSIGTITTGGVPFTITN